jgi:hypothetical protein
MIEHITSLSKEDCPLKDLIKGKRVALVGPAKYLLKQNRGAEFDSYDYVARINAAVLDFPFKPELAQHIGSRLDILFLNPHIPHHSDFQDKLLSCNPALVMQKGVKESNPRSKERLVIYDQIVPAGLKSKVTHPKKLEELRSYFRKMKRKGGPEPRTGLIGLIELLGAGASEVLMTGFTMYHGGGHIFKEKAGKFAGQKDLTPFNPSHDSANEIVFMRELIKQEKRVIIDPELEEIMKDPTRFTSYEYEKKKN